VSKPMDGSKGSYERVRRGYAIKVSILIPSNSGE
jgi:hypothetical protein